MKLFSDPNKEQFAKSYVTEFTFLSCFVSRPKIAVFPLLLLFDQWL